MAVRAIRGATQLEEDARDHMLERETDLPRADITHVYLHGAAALRSDLTRVRSVPDGDE